MELIRTIVILALLATGAFVWSICFFDPKQRAMTMKVTAAWGVAIALMFAFGYVLVSLMRAIGVDY